MRATLYAVETKAGWVPMVSVAWEVDERFWRESSFRLRVAEECAEAARGKGVDSVAGAAMSRVAGLIGKDGMLGDRMQHDCERTPQVLKCGKPLPLGIAERACRYMQQRKSSPQSNPFAWMREAIRSSLLAAGDASEASDSQGGEANELYFVSTNPEPGQQKTGPLSVRSLVRAALILGERLQGRALLRDEATALLAQELPEACDAASTLQAIQLAALLGLIRLRSAIAEERLQIEKTSFLQHASILLGKIIGSQRPGKLSAGQRRGKLSGGQGRGKFAILHCRRCGAASSGLASTDCASCGRRGCAYCEACLTMGRSRECGLLLLGRPSVNISGIQSSAKPIADHWLLSAPKSTADRWSLSPAQADASAAALGHISKTRKRKRNEFLLWAVTGAGKTEMTFPLIDSVLAKGGRVLVATPRRDVVLELAPRLRRAFPDVIQAVLYGGSPDKFANAALTLSTTHQLLRFHEAFDLVLIDELDAFPYHNDRMLQYAAAKAGKPGAATVLLSATPPPKLKRKAAWGLLPHARIPVRHHRRPLPVPQRLNIPPLQRWLPPLAPLSAVPPNLLKPLLVSLRRGAQVFFFVPVIMQIDPLVRLLRQNAATLGIPPEAIDGTSSKDEERAVKVERFRQSSIRLLVTTTILERGVTIPKSDVFVLGADRPIFDAASLVQMAGRAGRSKDDSDGRVYFAAPLWTSSQRTACREIRGMNREARRKGYLA